MMYEAEDVEYDYVRVRNVDTDEEYTMKIKKKPKKSKKSIEQVIEQVTQESVQVKVEEFKDKVEELKDLEDNYGYMILAHNNTMTEIDRLKEELRKSAVAAVAAAEMQAKMQAKINKLQNI